MRKQEQVTSSFHSATIDKKCLSYPFHLHLASRTLHKMYNPRDGHLRQPPRYVMTAGTHMVNNQKSAWQKKNVEPMEQRPDEEVRDADRNLIEWATAEIAIPGLRQLKNPKYNKLGKLFWFLSITTAALLCMYQVGNRCKYYSEGPITNDVLISRDDYLDFPATTICTTNSALFNDEAKKTFTRHFFRENTSDPEVMKERFEFWKENLERVNGNVTKLWNLMSIDLEKNIDISDSCPNKTCFYKRYIPTYKGDCVIVEAPEKVFHRGSLTGVDIHIKTNMPDIDKIDENLIKIYIHENDWTPIYFNYYDTSVYHGQIITVTLTRRRFKFLNTKKDPCTTTKGTADCWRECLESSHVAIGNRSCRILPNANTSVPICKTAESINASQFAIIKRFEMREKWQCDHCARRCSEVLFNILQDVVKPGKKGTTILKIYVPDNTIDSLNESYSYDFVSLLCELGGTLGLFLGFCSLTLLEVIEVFFGFLLMKFQKWKNGSLGRYKKMQQSNFQRSFPRVIQGGRPRSYYGEQPSRRHNAYY